MNTNAELLRGARLAKGQGVRRAARGAGVHHSHLSRLERGLARLGYEAAFKLARYYRIALGRFELG